VRDEEGNDSKKRWLTAAATRWHRWPQEKRTRGTGAYVACESPMFGVGN
jgi:hypothetical protein